MKIQRTLPPAAAPLYLSDLWNGFKGFFVGKRYLRQLEKELKDYFGVKHVFLVSSGKAGLYLILQALKTLRLGKNEVLIPAYTCFSVPSAIVKAGLKVALCDINPKTFDFDHSLLKDAINDNILCIVPDHLFGIPSNMDSIVELCRGKGIFIVEDAAQAMGGEYKGKLLGTIGDVGLFSLGRGKNITCGGGGIIVTSDDRIGQAIEQEYVFLETQSLQETFKDFISIVLQSLFIHPSFYWFPAGLRFLKLGETVFYRDFSLKRLSRIRAGLLRGWQKKLEEISGIRKENAQDFSKRVNSGTDKKDSISYLRYPVVINGNGAKNKLIKLLLAKNLGISRMYPTPINVIEAIRSQFHNRTFPVAESVANGLITLPTHQFVKEKDKKEVCSLLTQLLSKENLSCLN
jgi:perosamine synthetase